MWISVGAYVYGGCVWDEVDTVDCLARWRKGWKKEEKGIIDIERGFPLFEILRLKMYSLESFESQCIDVSFSFASYSFYRPKVA